MEPSSAGQGKWRRQSGLKSIIRKLERLNLDADASDAQKPAPPIALKAGTRLVREWHGVTYTVLVDALTRCGFFAGQGRARGKFGATYLPRGLLSGKFCQAPRHNLVVSQFEFLAQDA
jgi:hypothetical protein